MALPRLLGFELNAQILMVVEIASGTSSFYIDDALFQ
jgi:hypothetical protein